MTPKQIDRVKKKISDIRRILANERKKYGYYDDSRGLRYLPTGFYIKIQNFQGGLMYTRWFDKNFSDDIGFPGFLFEWTIILYMTGKLKEAEKKAFQTNCSDTYLFDKYFDKPMDADEKLVRTNRNQPEHLDYFKYSSQQIELLNFTDWLKSLVSSEKFIKASDKFVGIKMRLEGENDYKARSYLIDQLNHLKYGG